MANRRVRATRKSADGDILALCNSGEFWSPRSKTDAIADIDKGWHRYFVVVHGYQVDVHVVRHPKFGRYLRTDPDKTTTNNLDNLPDC